MAERESIYPGNFKAVRERMIHDDAPIVDKVF